MNSNILLSFGLVALLSLNTYHALSTQEKDEQYVSFNDDMESDDDTNMSLDSRSMQYEIVSSNGHYGPMVEKVVEYEDTIEVLDPKRKYRGLPYKYFGNIKFILDKSFTEHFGRSNTEFRIFEQINALFKLDTLGVWFDWTFDGYSNIPHIQVSLDGNGVGPLVAGQYTDADVVVFLTHQPGVKKTGTTLQEKGLCSRNKGDRAVVVNHYGSIQETARNAARQIGFLLGMQKDYTTPTNLRPCAMTYSGIMGRKEANEWTTCNFIDFLDFYKTKKSNFCLRTSERITK